MPQLFIFGDSITYGAGDAKGGWVQIIREHFETDQPAAEYLVYNLGVSGDTTEELLERFEPELKSRLAGEEKTTIVFAIGINDSLLLIRSGDNVVPVQRFKKNMSTLVSAAKKYCDTVVLVGLTPVNEKKVDPIPWMKDRSYRNGVIALYEKVIEDVARKEDAVFVPLLRNLSTAAYASSLEDGVHPNHNGHEMIAKEVLTSLKQLTDK